MDGVAKAVATQEFMAMSPLISGLASVASMIFNAASSGAGKASARRGGEAAAPEPSAVVTLSPEAQTLAARFEERAQAAEAARTHQQLRQPRPALGARQPAFLDPVGTGEQIQSFQRQLGDELDPPRILVGRGFPAAMILEFGDQFLVTLAFAQHDDGLHHRPSLRIGRGDRRCFRHRRMAEQG